MYNTIANDYCEITQPFNKIYTNAKVYMYLYIRKL